MLAATTPRILWVELTSKCPFDCVFCSRKSRRGSGEHMPFPLFESLVRQVDGPRRFLLNYSGESTVYPELIPAIRLARSTGAAVELVSVLASAPDALLEPLASSGLTRLTVSIHAADSASFDGIYRYSSFETLRARLVRFVELCRTVPRPPVVDIAFVAMQRNLGALTAVAELAGGLGLHAVSVFPVIRRDEIPVEFPEELTPLGAHRDPFRERVARGVEEAGHRCRISRSPSATRCSQAPARPSERCRRLARATCPPTLKSTPASRIRGKRRTFFRMAMSWPARFTIRRRSAASRASPSPRSGTAKPTGASAPATLAASRKSAVPVPGRRRISRGGSTARFSVRAGRAPSSGTAGTSPPANVTSGPARRPPPSSSRARALVRSR